MSHRIVFKGGLPDEFMEDSRGYKLSELWKEGKLNGIVDINGNTYDAKSIKAILSGFSNPDTNDRNALNLKELQKIKTDHEAATEKKLAQSPEIRAKNTGLAEVMYMAFRGQKMPQDVREQVIEAQMAFFTKNPDFADANPICYKHLIGNPARPQEKEAARVVDLLPAWALNFAERTVSAGIK